MMWLLGGTPMHLSRRSLLTAISAAFGAAFVRNSYSQTQAPPQAGPARTSTQLTGFEPYQTIEAAASRMKRGDSDSVRAVVEAMVAFPRVYRMPEIMAAVVKQRLIDAQMAYLEGKNA